MKGHRHPRASSAKTRGFHTQLDEGPEKTIIYKTNNCAAVAAAKSLQSCLTLCDPIDGSPPSSPIPGILQATRDPVEVAGPLGTPLGPTLSDPMDCSPPDSSIHGILQARVLEWVAISFSIET